MAELTAGDLRAALDFLGDAYSFEDLDSFRRGILPGLEKLVPCDLVGYNEVDPGGEALVLTHPHQVPDSVNLELPRLAHQHPLIAAQLGGDLSARKISDFLSRREFHSLALYNDLYRHIGAEDQIAVGLPGPVVIGIAMNRDRRSFGDRERAMLDLLGPHLARAHRRALEQTRLGALLSALEQDDRAVLVLERNGGIAAASGAAIGLLREYFPAEREAIVPGEIATWVAAAATGAGGVASEPLIVAGPRGTLSVRLLAGEEDLLVLHEERAVTVEGLRRLGLTRRQGEVLRLIAAGSGVGEIAAELFISPRTVRKHLEHIYARLGVHSRGAAVEMARAAR